MAVPEEVKEFNKQVCSDYPKVKYVFVCGLLLIFSILSIVVAAFQISRTFGSFLLTATKSLLGVSMH